MIEVVDGDKLARTTKEQAYIDEYLDAWDGCYNFQKKAIQRGGKIVNLEVFRRKVSKAKKAFYQTEKGQNLIRRLSEQKLGKTYEEMYGAERAEEIKEKIRQNKLIEMNKPEVKENLRKQRFGKTDIEFFGKERAAEIAQKRSKARKGKYLSKESSRYRVITNVSLISPSGELFTRIEGIKDFAKQHNLSPNHLCELLKGKRKSHKGWKMRVED